MIAATRFPALGKVEDDCLDRVEGSGAVAPEICLVHTVET
jgi:hypothetical protein